MPSGDTLWLRDVEIGGVRSDVLVAGEHIRAVAPVTQRLRPVGSPEVVNGRGRPLVPGLVDHHLHLLAWAAADESVPCREFSDLAGLVSALRSAPLAAGGFVRATGYHERLGGFLDRQVLDRLLPDRPLRIQHRTGALWMLNSAALAQLVQLDASHRVDPDVERDPDGRPTGRLWRFDTRLRNLTPTPTLPDLAAVGTRLAALGITAVTDATPDLPLETIRHLAAQHAAGRLPQQAWLLGAPDEGRLPPGLHRGPRKLHLRDHDLPDVDELTWTVADSHRRGRPVAVHCVSADALALTIAALTATGVLPGDRIEHAAVVPPPTRTDLARLGVSVVTQPGFVHERGDDYCVDVDEPERSWLYPWRSLRDAGVTVVPSSDAPHTSGDPWAAVIAASTRRTRSGSILGSDEKVEPEEVLAGYLRTPSGLSGRIREVRPGSRADLVLLREAFPYCLRDLESAGSPVALTVIAGAIINVGRS